jgi:F0F1-type ATP synthase assembly protein I
MGASLLAAARRDALRVVLWQVLSVLIVSVGCFAIWNVSAARSILAGGGIGVVATAYMAFALLRQGEQVSASRVALNFFIGWVVKVLITVSLLLVAMRSKAIAPVFLMAGFSITFVAYWFVFARRRN